MGAWSVSITGNDTAQDLYSEYSSAFYMYEVDEALERIDRYVRAEMFDESDEEEWCNYYYSLADFMWKKGILKDSVRDQTIKMIDSEFGLGLWVEAGQKTLEARKKKLAEFKEKILSPQPQKKRIKPNVHTERIFKDGDVIAVQLQTAGKPYLEAELHPMSEEAFHALDGKYIIMQLMACFASWTSEIVPEVKDYWACCRLFDGIYDTVPDCVDVAELKEARIYQGYRISSHFTCESSLFYFKRRKYKILCNRKDLVPECVGFSNNTIYWGNNKPWLNPDSQLVAAMGILEECCEYAGTPEELQRICSSANRHSCFYKEGNAARFAEEENAIAEKIKAAVSRGGKVYSILFGRPIGIVTVENGHIDNLYIEGQFQKNGFGTRLLEYVFSVSGKGAYLDVPATHETLLRICEKLDLMKINASEHTVRMVKQ